MWPKKACNAKQAKFDLICMISLNEVNEKPFTFVIELGIYFLYLTLKENWLQIECKMAISVKKRNLVQTLATQPRDLLH